jgi:prolyl-tRNA synthetase
MKEFKALGVRVKFDDSDTNKPGWKFAEYELQGVPVRLALGGRDLEQGTIEVARRDTKTKETMALEGIEAYVQELLDTIQTSIFQKAFAFREENTHRVDTLEEFEHILDTKGGFILAHWDGTSETEEQIKERTKATIRCIPLEDDPEEGTCIFSGKPSSRRVVFARAY